MMFFFTIGLSLAIFSSVIFTWSSPFLTTSLLVLILFAQLFFWPPPRTALVMGVAALLGTPAEIVEVALGEWQYHGTHLIFGVPMWIPLIWANLFGLFGRLAMLGGLWIQNSTFYLWLTRFIVLFCVICVVLMNKQPVVIALYIFFLLLGIAFWNQSKDKMLFLFGGVLGAFGEYVAIQLGYWHYYNPFFQSLGVDITLPLDWGLSAVIIHRIADYSFTKK
ncbi:MAG: hypothetical protein H7832_14235 [Magnetococcus sp. DMHC-6]